MSTDPSLATTMDVLPIRLSPGDDLRRALEAALANAGHEAGFVLAGIGSLSRARLRFAEVDDAPIRTGAFEILTLCGSVSPEASHLHATLADVHHLSAVSHEAPFLKHRARTPERLRAAFFSCRR